MTEWSRHAAGWLAAIGVVAVLAAALVLRGGSTQVGQGPEPSTAAPTTAATPSPTSTPRSTPEPTAVPTATPEPATPTPMPATPAPTPVAVAPAPAATPAPVHDNDPVLMTHDRVDGSLGQTLTIDGYSVRAVRLSEPSDNQCATILEGDEHFYEITVTYSGPLFDVSFDLGGGISMWCIDHAGEAPQQFPSGVPRTIVARPAENSSSSGLPFAVFVTTVNGPHVLWYVFN
jgi:hypothetical protein